MLEEMSSESVSRLWNSEVSGRDPGPTLDQIVLVIKCWHREVIIYGMHLESGKGVYRSAAPLPDVSHWVIHASDVEFVNRRWRGESQANVSLVLVMIKADVFQGRIELVLSR